MIDEFRGVDDVKRGIRKRSQAFSLKAGAKDWPKGMIRLFLKGIVFGTK